MRYGRRVRSPLVVAGAAAAVAALAGARAPAAPAPPLVPSKPPTSFRAIAANDVYSWQLPESFAGRRIRRAAFVGDVVEHRGTRFYGATGGSRGIVERRIYAARPDGYSFSSILLAPSEFALTQACAGQRRLAPSTAGRRPAWRTRYALRANDCAGLRRGSLEVWLDRETLLPLRVLERRGRRTYRSSFRYTSVGARLPARAFVRPRLGRRPRVSDLGFRRVSPAAAARALSYRPQVPTALPAGFRLAVSGWAPWSARTGPEASNPRYRQLFAAVYRRGFERIDVTQRLAGARGWVSDPFGAECQFQRTERASVRGRRATYGIGTAITPHLYWRDGEVLVTVSGALPKRDLVAIANSLVPVGGLASAPATRRALP